MKSNQFDHYRETQIKTASPGKLLLMLYDGALRFLNIAKKALEEEPRDIEKAHNNIIKIQNIITELTVTLDMEKGGEISVNLKDLYVWVKNQLILANSKKEVSYLVEVEHIISELRDAWKQVVAKEEGKDNSQSDSLKKINVTG
ncbi:MAG: flagellar export chaperone FliS [Candidatus Muiribacteriota bacterium]